MSSTFRVLETMPSINIPKFNNTNVHTQNIELHRETANSDDYYNMLSEKENQQLLNSNQ